KYGTRVLFALLLLVLGFWVAGILKRSLAKVLEKRKIDESLTPFVLSLTHISLKILVVISSLSMIGVEMTSFIALLGAAGLAVGMALSGTLQNFAGGVIILIIKPFKVNDVVEAQGYLGTVKEIQIFNTILITFDHKTIILPNGGLATGSLINYSTQETRRVDWRFSIAYGDDFDKVKRILLELINMDTRILSDPLPFVALGELADSGVVLVVRVWVNTPDYWNVFFDLNEKVYKTFAKEGVNIPFPQMEVRITK
ncbi:MAG TPA: mechanosensitive ion channel protein MscS, partial [Bacteroidales bacterium]|nr:mechanosensitive ion channel protein MscS [Bacteroidales bacterium]